MTLDEAIAAIAVHLGQTNEENILNMSIPFFNDVLTALGKSLNYAAVSNLYGNSFCKDASKYISQANPLYKKPKMDKGFLGILTAAPTIKINDTQKEFAKKQVDKALGTDISWAEGLI